jgi:hypothetical protein
VAVVGLALVVVSLGTPRAGRAISACLAAGFLVAAVDPNAPDPEATLLTLTALALVCAVAASIGHVTAHRIPSLSRPSTSSRQLRAAVRTHQRRRALV